MMPPFPVIQNIPVSSALGKQIRHGFMAPDPHQLVEIDNDGNHTRYFRHYRYVCRCGKTGSWQPSILAARGEHDVHRSDTECPEAAP
jgi:hypothetical protein